jgi:hypothetical protein
MKEDAMEVDGEGERIESVETVYTVGIRHTHTLLYRPSDSKEVLTDDIHLTVLYNGVQIDEQVCICDFLRE